MGRRRKFQIREDWEEVKDDVMRKASFAKFSQNKDIKDILISTDNIKLIENSPFDYYWGSGFDNSGLNRLGSLLMELRNILLLDKNS